MTTPSPDDIAALVARLAAYVNKTRMFVDGVLFSPTPEVEMLTASLAALEALAAQHKADSERIALLEHTRRWNVDEGDDGNLLICKGEHEKSDKCEYETFVPLARAEAAEARATAAEQQRDALLLRVALLERGLIKHAPSAAVSVIETAALAPATEAGDAS